MQTSSSFKASIYRSFTMPWQKSGYLKKSVQVFDSEEAFSFDGFMEKFCEMLRRFTNKVYVRKSYSEVDKKMPLIVLCYKKFRVGTDVENATKEVFADDAASLNTVAIAVVHIKDIHALPSSRSRTNLMDEKYDRVGLIVDVAFGTNGKIYQCTMNDEAFQSFQQFIEVHSKEEPSTEDEPKTSKISPPKAKQLSEKAIQLYYQKDSERVSTFLTKMNGLAEQINVVELISVLDRNMAQPLVAVIERHSILYNEFCLSSESQKSVTILFVLQDDTEKSFQLDKMEGIYLSETLPNLKERVQSILEKYKEKQSVVTDRQSSEGCCVL